MQISIKLNDSEVKKKLTEIEQKQLPYATARALTKTAQVIGQKLVADVNSNMLIRGKGRWAGKLANAKKDGSLSPSAAFNAVAAQKKDGMNRMAAKVGTIGWQMAEQVGERNTLRKPRRAKQRLKNLQAKKYQTPNKMLERKKVFVQSTSKGPMMLQRVGKKKYPLRPLFAMVKQQEVKPKVSLKKHAETWAPKVFPGAFKKYLEQAVKTAK